MITEGWHYIPLVGHPAFSYFRGDEEPYREYIELNKKLNPDNEHSLERIAKLKESLNSQFDDRCLPFVDENNQIMDGIHRCCWLSAHYGSDYIIKVVKLYGKWKVY